MTRQSAAAHSSPVGPSPTSPAGRPERGRRRRRWVVSAAVLVVVLLAGVPTVVVAAGGVRSGGFGAVGTVASRSAHGSSAGSDVAAVPQISVDVPGWHEGQPITDEVLRAVRPEDLFWTVYKRLSLIAVHEVVQEVWIANAGKSVAPQNLVAPELRTRRVIFDYRSKAIARVETSRSLAGDLTGAMICVDGKRYSKTETAIEQNRPYAESAGGGQDCPSALTDAVLKRYGNLGLWVNDALMTGGLTSAQADGFIDCLRERQLVSVTSAVLVQANGTSYVAVEGEVNRVQDRAVSVETRQGHGLVRDCFDIGTGVKQELHPYPFSVGGAQGLRWTYYLDPASLRPVFSRRETTPVAKFDGSASPGDADYNASIAWVRWAYPANVPRFTLADGERPLAVAWPLGLPGK